MDEENLEGIKKIVYFPSETDKAVFIGLCNEIIDLLEPLRIEQKAFLLAQLVASFEDTSGIKFNEIYTSYRENQKVDK